MYDENIISNEKLQEKCLELIFKSRHIIMSDIRTSKPYTQLHYIKLRKIMEILEG